MFNSIDIDAGKLLSETTDHINRKYGREKIKFAIQGDGKEWKLKQEMLSGKYTTQWNDIIRINTTIN